MTNLFFRELGIPEPDSNLEVGSASHAVRTSEIMKAFEPMVLKYKPQVVLVVGDVNSTIACGFVAVKLGVKLAHVEASLRSFDRTMLEEINRVLTDSSSDLLFCTEQSGVENLLNEGVQKEKIPLVGYVMIDTLLKNLEKSKQSTIIEELHCQGYLDGEGFAVLTMHRPLNVDDRIVFSRILDALEVIQYDLPMLFPVHPRTRKNLSKLGFRQRVEQLRAFHLIEPLGYLDFLKLMSSAKVVLTDSGGIQEETTILKVPCVTLRENTERPITAAVESN
jgi:UDP-N-acetylglucosamine 2-epimerase (non-hydrolysing)